MSLSAARPLLVLVVAAPLLGCSSGVKLFPVSGTVTFDGKPIPAGRLYFNPDVGKGNDGPQGYADIREGKFDTREGGRGTPGGPMVIRIEGFEAGSDAKSYGKPSASRCSWLTSFATSSHARRRRSPSMCRFPPRGGCPGKRSRCRDKRREPDALASEGERGRFALAWRVGLDC
jgi:hypothetical protein